RRHHRAPVAPSESGPAAAAAVPHFTFSHGRLGHLSTYRKPLDPNGQALHTAAAMSHPDTALDQLGAPTAARATPTDRVRVLVADPDPLARRALTDALREDGGFLVIGQAADAVEAVELARHYRPDLVLLAAHLPNVDAIAICER